MQTRAMHQGRLRFRNEALKAADFAYTVQDALRETRGVIKVQVNKRIGSLLVLFDKTKVSLENILERIARALGVDTAKVKASVKSMQASLTGRTGRRVVKRGMLAALAAALGIVFYSEKLHVAAGVAFVHLLALHIYQNRRTLMN